MKASKVKIEMLRKFSKIRIYFFQCNLYFTVVKIMQNCCHNFVHKKQKIKLVLVTLTVKSLFVKLRWNYIGVPSNLWHICTNFCEQLSWVGFRKQRWASYLPLPGMESIESRNEKFQLFFQLFQVWDFISAELRMLPWLLSIKCVEIC
jgi:hypothetical protein